MGYEGGLRYQKTVDPLGNVIYSIVMYGRTSGRYSAVMGREGS
jgi:hypothetical protein